MPSQTPTSPTKAQKPKKVVMSSGRGGSGNFRKVQTKKYATETKDALSCSTNKRMLEIDLPRNKAAYSGRGGFGNKYDHVLEDGVFDRVIQYELGKVKASQGDRDEKRRSSASNARTRTYSTSKASKSVSLGSEDAAASTSANGLRRSWMSHSTVDVSVQSGRPSDTRKSLRATLLAPLRTTFTRRPQSLNSIKDDTSSFSACSSGDHSTPPAILEGQVSPIDHSTSPISHTSDDTYSALTPSTAEMFGELAGRPVPRRRSTGTHRSPRNSRLAPPLPSPMTPLPPIPTITVEEGRSSLPSPLSLPGQPLAVPQPTIFRSRIEANISMKSLQANPLPVSQGGYHSSSSELHSQDKLSVPVHSLRPAVSSNLRERAPNRKFYNAAVAARSMGSLPVSYNSREASFYDGSDVDRVDPFLAELGCVRAGGVTDKSFETLLPWIDAPNSALSSVSSISIPSLNDSRPELVAS